MMTSTSTSTTTGMPLPEPTIPTMATSVAGGVMFSDADVAEVRHVVQRILVPCVFVIGLLGNSVSIYVLTRKRMRCTTNIYLTALAITDIAYLTFQLILTLQHYDYVKHHCEIYWRLYGLFVWLCDVCAYISIYIAVCFTIERFIAIRYPLKRQTFCTESLAKKVIAAVALFCLLSTLSTPFEHKIGVDWNLIDGAYKPCNLTLANVSPIPSMPTPATNDDSMSVTTTKSSRLWLEEPSNIDTTTEMETDLGLSWDSGSGNGDGEPVNIPHRQYQRHATPASVDMTGPATKEHEPIVVTESLLQFSDKLDNAQINDTYAFNITEYCQNTTVYMDQLTHLGANEMYQDVWSLFTLLLFVLLPLLLLATFNSFLILLVHRSKSVRGDLTNANSIRRAKRKSASGLTGSVSQENRVTITLIAVVLLFIVCQLPWAIFLVVERFADIENNIKRIIGNVCNLLGAINAASNFFLYCVLSDKYRKTVRELITGYRYRHRHGRNNTSLYYVPHTTLTHINGIDGNGHHQGGGGGATTASTRRNRCSNNNNNKSTTMGRLIS
ncbi:uncharacterized protein Proc-R [Drosophila tropicalis]|uniref:uncharacterized protein Proc-R n=1 Tax=Drosophila tropicalis TaxID=46794 RepID=UPI0035ABC70D